MAESDSPDSPPLESAIADLLSQLEMELRRLGLWSPAPPSAEALASQLPFCYDTLALGEWLQWVFLPRFRAILAQGAPLPERMAIGPVAELEYGEDELATARLLGILRRLDGAVSQDGHASIH